MEHIAALLLVVSCSQDLSGCREISVPTAVFEAYEDCQTELPRTLRSLDMQNQRMFAKCLEVDPALEDDYDQLRWSVLPNGTLEASLTISNTVAVAGVARPEKGYAH